MVKYTEKQAKEDAVTLWEAVLDYVKNPNKFNPRDSIETIKSKVVLELPARFDKLENHCSYCEYDKKSRHCYRCIGVVNNVFGDDATICTKKGSRYENLRRDITPENVENLLEQLKRVLKDDK